MKKFKRILIITVALSLFLLGAKAVLAATASDLGVDQVSSTINLVDTGPQEIITRIINIGLGFLGFIAVCIILWGGFVWMKSGGSADQISKAQNILKAGIVGLLIIVSAWGITTFIINKVINGNNGSGGSSQTDPTLCTNGLSCLCGGHIVCTNNIGSCVGSQSPCTNPQTSCSSVLGSCVKNDSLCNSPDKFCNNSCVCENKSQGGESCGLKSDGSCDISGNKCADGLVCNPNVCFCEGPITISGVSPVGGFCKNDINKVCGTDADCPSSTCDTETPNGKAGNLLTISGSNFFKYSSLTYVFQENFESYPVNQAPSGTAFSSLIKGVNSDIQIKNSPFNSKSLYFKQNPGNTDGSGTAAEITYQLASSTFEEGHSYQLMINRITGRLGNGLEIYLGDQKISTLAPKEGEYNIGLGIPIGFTNFNNKKIRFSLLAGPTGLGTDLYLDDIKILDQTVLSSVTIGGVLAKPSWYTNPFCQGNTTRQLILAVPEGVQNGEIKIVRGQEIESTNDDNGPKIKDFVVNTIDRPGLCSLSPQEARTDQSLNFYGVKLNSTTPYFGDFQTNISSNRTVSNPNLGSVKVPLLVSGQSGFFVMDGLKKSNFLFFNKLNDLPPAPVITAITPKSGTSEQYVTINGRNFGNNRGNGKVFFGNQEAKYTFPDECKFAAWSDNEILVKVPSGLITTSTNITVQTDSWVTYSSSSNLFFDYQANAPLKPGICKIDPNRGPNNSKTALLGENFGNSPVEVYFNAVLANSLAPTFIGLLNKVEVTVPGDAVSGQVKLKNNQGESNPVNFEVGACQKNTDCTSGLCCPTSSFRKGECVNDLNDCFSGSKNSVFEWTFGTGAGLGTTTNPFGSCLGNSKNVGSCQTDSLCPNTPGQCSSASMPITVSKGDCCPAGYVFEDGYCWEQTECPSGYRLDNNKCEREGQELGCGKGDGIMLCATLEDFANKNRLVYKTKEKCKDGWLKIKGDFCAAAGSFAELKESDNCAPCDRKGETCFEDRCVINLPNKDNGLTCGDNFDRSGGTYCKTLTSYGNKNRLVYSSSQTCKAGWLKIDNNLCAQGENYEELKGHDNCSPCNQSGEKCFKGRCIIDLQCKGMEKCTNGSCTVEEAPSCECCCDKNNGAADCCAPLTCSGTCGSSTKDDGQFGKCSGCMAVGENTETRDAACNCSGHNGQFCSDNNGKNPAGACVDCATLDADECLAHASVCCLDAQNLENGEPVCRGGAGDLISKDPKKVNEFGYCAYYNCAGGPSNKCASSSPVVNGAFSLITDCESGCKPTSTSTGLGLNCGGTSNQTTPGKCQPSVCSGAFGGTPFSCLSATGSTISSSTPSANGDCGICCCTPGNNDSCKALNSKLFCSANKGSCTGGSRGLCCGCSSDSECGIDAGCGSDTCCHPKPTVSTINPPANTENVCRNSVIKITFNQEMSGDSLHNENIKLLEELPFGSTCPTGTILAVDNSKTNFLAKIYQQFEKILVVVAKIFNRDLASADSTGNYRYCQVPTIINLDYSNKNATVVTIKPKTILGKEQNYLVFVKGNGKVVSPAEGVLSVDGVGMAAPGGLAIDSISFQALQANLESYYQQIEDINQKIVYFINENQKNKNDEKILNLTRELEGLERQKNQTGLEIIANVGLEGDKLVELKDKINYSESRRRDFVILRSKLFEAMLKGDQNFIDQNIDKLNILNDELRDLLESVDPVIKEYASWSPVKDFYQGAISAKINNNTYKAYISRFKTKEDICEINYTTLAPHSYLFSTLTNDASDDVLATSSFDKMPDRDKVFQAKAFSADDQELTPVPGYDWSWDYQLEDSKIIFLASSTNSGQLLPANQVLATASSTTNDAKSLLYASVKMASNNQYKGGDGKKTSSELFVFICANPWPAIKSDGTWSPWTDSDGGSYNYGFHYCRDAGEPGQADDLPELKTDAVNNNPGQICSNKPSQTCTSTASCPSGGTCVWDILKESYFFQNN